MRPRDRNLVVVSVPAATKLYVPKLRRSVVVRPRLHERLSRGAESKLTLISAPAGFGKTTLVAEWLAAVPAGGPSAAWLSLDSGDNQTGSSWSYVIAALQTVAPEVGAAALSLLQAPRPPPIETVLAPLLNELNAVSNDIVLRGRRPRSPGCRLRRSSRRVFDRRRGHRPLDLVARLRPGYTH